MQARRGEPSRRQQPRLPVIAPRDDGNHSFSDTAPNALLASTIAHEGPRTRLPPRSRSGCWTCRSRKVKCDEQRPTCGQCARLNHNCDYNPRLAFRDDTARVKERMQEVKSEGNSVWDPHAPLPDFELDRNAADILPSFSALRSDEERERKAELTSPGTYVVVTNPNSFATLPEYAETQPATTLSSSFPGFSDPFGKNPISNSTSEVLEVSEDPNIVILKNFEDIIRRGSTSSQTHMAKPISPTMSFDSRRHSSRGQISVGDLRGSIAETPPSLLEQARRGGPDAHLLVHYREEISARIMKVDAQGTSEDVFEREARNYDPLFHAMMAISALSLAHKTGVASTEAMIHYGIVLASLREASEQSSISDGAMFIHYLLLLYEIAHSGSPESRMWTFHCDALIRIITARRALEGIIPHPFIVWMVCLIDTYALLSGSGSGAFIRSLRSGNLLPVAEDCLPPVGTNPAEHFFTYEVPYFPTILELHQKTVLLALQVAETAAELRNEDGRAFVGGQDALANEQSYLMNRRHRVRAMQELCRSLSQKWEKTYAQYWPFVPHNISQPHRVREYLHHAHNLYRACVIYAHTSMYPGQMLEAAPEYSTEVSICISEILATAMECMQTERWEINSLTFSLFLAGYASTDMMQKNTAINLMRTLEPHSFGGNTAAMRRLLVTVSAKQQASIYTIGLDLNVSWINELESANKGLIMFDL